MLGILRLWPGYERNWAIDLKFRRRDCPLMRQKQRISTPLEQSPGTHNCDPWRSTFFDDISRQLSRSELTGKAMAA
jgi:hypothetical protein